MDPLISSIRCQTIADVKLIALTQESGLVSREGIRPLIELGLNLAIELADSPATAHVRFAFCVERARVSASNCQEPHVVRPREREARRTLLGKRTEQLCRQRHAITARTRAVADEERDLHRHRPLERARRDRKPAFAKDFSSRTLGQIASKRSWARRASPVFSGVVRLAPVPRCSSSTIRRPMSQ